MGRTWHLLVTWSAEVWSSPRSPWQSCGVRRGYCGRKVWFIGLVHWGLTPQQQPGSYQGGEMMMKSVIWWRKPEYPEETTDLRQVTDETYNPRLCWRISLLLAYLCWVSQGPQEQVSQFPFSKKVSLSVSLFGSLSGSLSLSLSGSLWLSLSVSLSGSLSPSLSPFLSPTKQTFCHILCVSVAVADLPFSHICKTILYF